jgi:hypothetical protein
MRARLPALAIPFGVCALAIVALVLSIVAAPNDGSCDNIAGTCLRRSQDLLRGRFSRSVRWSPPRLSSSSRSTT